MPHPVPVPVPVLPESAPFSPEQRAYLNGFLAGLFGAFQGSPTTQLAPPIPSSPSNSPRATTPLTILFGSQTGTAEKLAKRIAKSAGTRGFAPTLHDLAKYPREQLASERHLLVVTSTYGDGEPPDNAKTFARWLTGPEAPRLPETRFAVCALGDSNYPRFCAFGRSLDQQLEALGATRAHARAECDVDYEQPFAAWLAATLAALDAPASSDSPAQSAPLPGSGIEPTSANVPEPADDAEPAWTRDRPYPARLLTNRRLGAPGSAKDVRHFEIDLGDSGLDYEVGDALGVWPRQDPALVDAVVEALGARGDEPVPGRDGQPTPLRDALATGYELGRIPPALLRHFADESKAPELRPLVAPDANGELTRFLRGRDILDLLRQYPGVRLRAAAFTGLLRRLQPRLYSIASSRKAFPGQVHLTVSAVRYESLGRPRHGVASTFLADRCESTTPLPVFLHANPAFRPPAPDQDLVMIGPGTGIAPFRAFLQERRAIGASGRNWLFFGDQHEATDFLYRDEIETFQREGTLHRLDLAWSRDQDAKVYVQHLMERQATDLWQWLESGASICVCGDASRMARDVDAALQNVIQTAGGKSPEQAAACLSELQANGRYRRDVY